MRFKMVTNTNDHATILLYIQVSFVYLFGGDYGWVGVVNQPTTFGDCGGGRAAAVTAFLIWWSCLFQEIQSYHLYLAH